MEHILCQPCAQNISPERRTTPKSFLHCRDGEYRLPPVCPKGHGPMIIAKGGEIAHCPVITGRDHQGRAIWCGALRAPVTYRQDGLPLPRENGKTSLGRENATENTMEEPIRMTPMAGRTPEDVLPHPMRRLCRFEYQCALCGNEHHLETYISIPARDIEEYQAHLGKRLEDYNFVSEMVQEASLDLHKETEDLERLAINAGQNGLYEVSSKINVVVTEESDYTCSKCGRTFRNIQLLQEHMPGCPLTHQASDPWPERSKRTAPRISGGPGDEAIRWAAGPRGRDLRPTAFV